MDGNNPVAPTGAEAPASVASTTNSNTSTSPSGENDNPTTPTSEQLAEYAAQYYGTSVESIKKAKSFVDNNKGFDNVFTERKKEISAPKNQPQPMAVENNPAQTVQQPNQSQQPNAPFKMPEGCLSNDEINQKRYFKDLAAEEKYQHISQDILNGKVFEEMGRLGVNPFVQGGVNDKVVRDFLDLYGRTPAPQPTSAPITDTPTVNWVDVGEHVSSVEDARNVMRQSIEMQQQGKGEHPKLQEAKDFLAQDYTQRHPAPMMRPSMRQGTTDSQK